MEIAVKQAHAIEVAADDPWTFTEELAFGEGDDEYRYIVRWKVEGHYLAHATAANYAVGDENPTAALDDENAIVFEVTVKWDECCDFRVAPRHDGYVHTCSPSEVAAFAGALVYAQTRGLQILKAREATRLY